MILIIAEKPDMMKKISFALSNNPSKSKGFQKDKKFIFSHAVGHLVENKMPKEIDETYGQWKLSTLPFHFEDIPLKISTRTKEQYAVLKKLATSDEVIEIINACDADREGELIFRNILKTFPKTKLKGKKFTRMWLSATTPQAVQKSFNERKNLNEYNNLSNAATARSYGDYLVGMNATMGMTSAFSDFRNVLSIGRVQTPTLKIIVDLEEKIKNFKSENFWTLAGNIKAKDGSIVEASYFNKDLDKNRFFKKEDAEKTKEKIGLGDIKVIKVSDEEVNINQKKLYNLSDLQIDMGTRYGLGAQTVLTVAQSLYEKHSLTSYPRTDENYISSEFASELGEIIKTIVPFEEARKEIQKNNYSFKKSFIVPKEKIGAHEAITPVLNERASKIYNDLNDIEKKVYDSIVQRFLEAFFPAGKKRVQKAAFIKNEEIFQAQVENIISNGFLSVNPPEKKDLKTFPEIKKGDVLNLDKTILKEGSTQPPARFSEGTLIQTMKNPLKYVDEKRLKDILKENQGIGTEATRASIIEGLKKRNYITVDKKTLIPTEKGIELIKAIPGERIKSVALTAYFEEKLSNIASGKESLDGFLGAIKKLNITFIEELTETAKNKKTETSSFSSPSIAQCPNCGSKILSSKYGFYCEEKCGVSINKNALEKLFGLKTITQTQAKQLLEKGFTSKDVKLHSKKKNKDFNAKLTYEFKKEEKYPNNVWFKFETNKKGGKKK